jgi:hypothetical protein
MSFAALRTRGLHIVTRGKSFVLDFCVCIFRSLLLPLSSYFAPFQGKLRLCWLKKVEGCELSSLGCFNDSAALCALFQCTFRFESQRSDWRHKPVNEKLGSVYLFVDSNKKSRCVLLSLVMTQMRQQVSAAIIGILLVTWIVQRATGE